MAACLPFGIFPSQRKLRAAQLQRKVKTNVKSEPNWGSRFRDKAITRFQKNFQDGYLSAILNFRIQKNMHAAQLQPKGEPHVKKEPIWKRRFCDLAITRFQKNFQDGGISVIFNFRIWAKA